MINVKLSKSKFGFSNGHVTRKLLLKLANDYRQLYNLNFILDTVT